MMLPDTNFPFRSMTVAVMFTGLNPSETTSRYKVVFISSVMVNALMHAIEECSYKSSHTLPSPLKKETFSTRFI